MQLYTIHYDQLSLISQFDRKGHKTGEYEARVPVTLHDLPYQTACMYRDKMGKNLNFRMEAQHGSRDDHAPKRHEKKRHGYGRGEISVATAATKPGRSTIEDAARSGDMSAALNER